MIQLNLLPDIKREYLKARHAQSRVISISVLLSLIAVGVTVALALWVYVAQGLYKNLLANGIATNQSKVEATEDVEKYVTIQNQLANLTKLHDNNNDFSRLLAFLPVLNPKAPNSVRFNSVEIADDTQQLSIRGEANNFTGLVTLRDILLNAELSYKVGKDASLKIKSGKLFSDVVIAEQQLAKTSKSGSVVTFRITATYAKEAFMSSSTDTVVSVPRIETTPSKQDSPNLFSGSTATESVSED